MKKGILKKICATALVAVMGLGLVGCGGSKTDESADLLDQIKKNGELVVGLSADYAPYEFHAMIDGKDTIVGFDVKLAEEVAKDLGVKLTIKEMEFDALLTALPAGQLDVVISGLNPSPERKDAMDFSEIYYYSEHGVLVKSGDENKYSKIEDLDGKKVGVQLGSTQEQIAQEKLKNSELKQLANLNNLILELKAGNVEAVITEVPVGKLAENKNSDVALTNIKIEDETGGNAIGVRKNNPKLLAEINKTVKRLVESGDMDKYVQEAFDLHAKQGE